MWMFPTTKLYFLWMNQFTFHTYFTPKYILHVTNQKKYGVKCDIMSGLYLILKLFVTYMALSYHQVDTSTSLILSTGAKTFRVWQIWGWNWMNFRIKLDSTRRKASEICLRPPLDIYSHTFSRNPKYDQYQQKDHHNEKIHRAWPKCLETPNFTSFTKSK